MKNKICLVFRKRNQGTSIEELFVDLKKIFIKLGLNVDSIEVPYSKVSVRNLIRNVIYIHKQKGLIHITGDINYVTINPFKRMILTIHDMDSILTGNPVEVYIKKIFWIWLPSLFAKQITIISYFSKNQLIKIAPWVSNKTSVIHNPVNSQLKETPKEFNKNYPEILHLGTKSNKNLENTVKGLREILCKLIIVGALSQEQNQLLTENKIDFENHVNIPYSQICSLYERCDIVSFISKYEGFGLPVIEAQKVGRVLITSNKASIPEIAGNGAHFVNPENIQNINNSFLKLIEDDAYRNKLIYKGFENVKRFEIENISKKYLSLYEKMKR